MAKFDEDPTKIVNFLLLVHFLASVIFFESVSRLCFQISILGKVKLEKIKMEKLGIESEKKVEAEEEEEEHLEEPPEITELFTCPLCLKKYASVAHMENHIAIIHKVSKKIQRQSLQGGSSSLFVIKESVKVESKE